MAHRIYVSHCGGSIMCVGTYDECEYHRDSQDFNTSSWKIQLIEDYGQERYEEGYDAGYDSAAGESYIL